jgi:hypothetical protein
MVAASLLNLAKPNIAETDGGRGVTMRLQLDSRAFVTPIRGFSNVYGLARQLEVVLHQHAIVKDGDKGGAL